MNKRQILLVSAPNGEDTYWAEMMSKEILNEINISNKSPFVILGSSEIQTMKLAENLTLSKESPDFRVQLDSEFNKSNREFDTDIIVERMVDENDSNLLIVMNQNFIEDLLLRLSSDKNSPIRKDYDLSLIEYKPVSSARRVA